MTQTNALLRSAIRTALCALVLPMMLSGCADAKRALGYEKSAPDEFQVVQRAPLSMPPDFSLRPPQPGSVRPQEGSTRDQARQVLTGTRQVTPISTSGRSNGDVILLKRAGAENIQPDIRVLVNKETQALAESDKSFSDKLVFWRKPDAPGEVLDAVKETQRLRENQALGKSLSEGDTPQITRRRKAWLEGVFN
jgi:hypothetical protein